jgi:Ring finger domain
MTSEWTDGFDSLTMLLLFGIGLWFCYYLDGQQTPWDVATISEGFEVGIHQVYTILSGLLALFQLAHVIHGMVLRQKPMKECLRKSLITILAILILSIVAVITFTNWAFFKIFENEESRERFNEADGVNFYIRLYYYFFFGLINTLLVITLMVYLSTLAGFLVSLCPKKNDIKTIDKLYLMLKESHYSLETLRTWEGVEDLIENAAFTRMEFEMILNNHTEDYSPSRKVHQTLGAQVGLQRDSESTEQQDQTYLICELCVEKVKEAEDITALPGCRHKYHKACMLVHMTKNRGCPKCKSSIRLALLKWKTKHLFTRPLPRSSFTTTQIDEDIKDRSKSSILLHDKEVFGYQGNYIADNGSQKKEKRSKSFSNEKMSDLFKSKEGDPNDDDFGLASLQEVNTKNLGGLKTHSIYEDQ